MKKLFITPKGLEESIGSYQQPNDDIYIGFNVDKDNRIWYKLKDITPVYKDWWRTVDKNNEYLIKLFSQMLGSSEQRIEQLYIIRNNLGL